MKMTSRMVKVIGGILGGCGAIWVGGILLWYYHRPVEAVDRSMGLTIATHLKALPPAIVVATVNGQAITERDVARREVFIQLADAMNGRAFTPESNSQAVQAIAQSFALVQSAQKAGIVVSAQQAYDFALKQYQMVEQTPALKNEKALLDAVISDLGLSPDAYIRHYMVPAAQQLLAISQMQSKLAQSIPKGNKTLQEWHQAQSAAVAAWRQDVVGSMKLVVVKPGY
ncbi:MAG: SurA N-terminal domain-containing protein [Firmicutes bacterium]|nr:SurA N-terminal domain-containing protein [Bacillota bacterium]